MVSVAGHHGNVFLRQNFPNEYVCREVRADDSPQGR